jgi:hypothetical protein
MSETGEGNSVRLYIFSEPRRSVWNMFRCFGALRMALAKRPVLPFVRALGCGKGIGFSLLPDLQRYAILAVGSEEQLDAFEKSKAVKALSNEAQSLEIYDLLPVKGHGAWDGEHPFVIGEPPTPGAPVAVITRARIPLRSVLSFIRHSYQVTASLNAASGRIFSIGIGELPFVRQATFSVWSGTEAMTAFAYQNIRHSNAIAATRKHKLFGEELFWRFAVRGYTKRPLA